MKKKTHDFQYAFEKYINDNCTIESLISKCRYKMKGNRHMESIATDPFNTEYDNGAFTIDEILGQWYIIHDDNNQKKHKIEIKGIVDTNKNVDEIKYKLILFFKENDCYFTGNISEGDGAYNV